MAWQVKASVDQKFHQGMEEHKEIEQQLKENLRTADMLEKAIEKVETPAGKGWQYEESGETWGE